MNRLYVFCMWCTIALFSLPVAAQTSKNAILKDTKWLEQQLNALGNENSADTGKKQFAFNQCQCAFKAQNSNGGGLSFDMNCTFDLNEVNSVTYVRNEDNTYELIVKLKTDKEKDTFNFNSISTTLYTSDEKKVKEVVSKFRSSVTTCNTSNK